MPLPWSYEQLARTGPIQRVKEEVLVETVRDLEYVGSVHQQLCDALESDDVPAAFTVRFIEELIAKGFVRLATWVDGYGGKPKLLDTNEVSVASAVERALTKEVQPFEFFLWSTELGDDWVARHEKLREEL